MPKSKLKRPTLKTAHEFHRDGIYPPGHEGIYQTEEEHRQEAVEIEKELELIVRFQFPRTHNLEYAILKAHLIVEHGIEQYVRAFSPNTVDAKALRFSSSQKLDIAYLMGFGGGPTLIPTIELLNRVRNQVAHKFSIDRSLVDELLRINAEDYDTYLPKNDRERIRGLKMMCHFVLGYISGHIHSHFHYSSRDRR
jgi:hypothetical protein